MPGFAGSDVFCSCGGQAPGIRGDADAAEVEAVGVEADGEGGVGLGRSTIVDVAGGDEKLHARVVELEMPGLPIFDGKLRAARAMAGVSVFVVTPRVVKDRKKTDNFHFSVVAAAKLHAVSQDLEPVGGAMAAGFGQSKLAHDPLPKRNLVRSQGCQIM